MKDFSERIKDRVDELNTRLVFALDLSRSVYSLDNSLQKKKKKELYQKASQILKDTEDHLAAVKINYPLLFALGPELIQKLLAEITVPIIGDFKVADIDNTSMWIGRHAFELGFEAVIAHGFIGLEGGLSGLTEEADKFGGGIILVINMSHPGSKKFITPRANDLAKFAVEIGADGVVAPATRPEEVREARNWIGDDILMFTPGIGAQGGKPGDAIKAGADFEIVGRGIYQAEDPADSAKILKKQMTGEK